MNSKYKLRKIISWLLTVLISVNSIPLTVMADTLTTDKTDEPIPEEFTELGIDESVEEDFIEFEDSSNKEEQSEADDTLSEDESIQTEIIEEQVDAVEIEQLSFSTQMEESNELHTASSEIIIDCIELPSIETSANSISFLGDGISLKTGTYTRWIDRLADLPEYATDFYEWLEENSNNNGTNDALIDVETGTSEFGGYTYPVVSWSGTISVSFSSNNPSQDDINKSVASAIKEKHASDFTAAIQYITGVYSAFDRDHPEIFWLDGNSLPLTACGGTGSFSIQDNIAEVPYIAKVSFALNYSDFDIRESSYQQKDLITSEIQNRDANIGTILSSITGADSYSKVKEINKWLTQNNCYNSNLSAAPKTAWECVSALDGRTNTNGPVCEGYARAFKVLCDKLSIPCVLVDGYAKNSSTSSGEAHMWNYVQMDDENWYAVDVTWNDPVISGSSAAISGAENENWFLLGSDTVVNGMSFLDSHPVSNTVTENGIAFTNGPVLAETKYGEATNKIVASGTCGENLTWDLDKDGVLTISGEGEMEDYDYEDDIPWYRWDYRRQITSVVIKEGVTSIGKKAFWECESLETVRIADGVVSIGEYAFYGTFNLQEINIPNGVTIIESGTFSGSGLSNINIPNTVISIEEYAFAYSELTSVVIPDSVISIGRHAFEQSCLTNVVIPKGITSIEIYAFYRTRLKNISIPESVISIGEYAFTGCNFTSVEIPNNVGSIGLGAFESCRSLTSITIPDSVTTIGNSAFINCSNLTDIYYYGTEEEWNAITIGSDNEALTGATIHFIEVEESLDLTVNVTSSATLTAPADGWKEGNNTFTVSCDKACYVAVSYDGGETYTRLPATASGNAYSFTADDVDANTIITVGVLGDVNGNGRIDALDARQIVVAITNAPDALKLITLDVNGNGRPDALDARKVVLAITGSPFTW